jgi:hypothetical protein
MNHNSGALASTETGNHLGSLFLPSSYLTELASRLGFRKDGLRLEFRLNPQPSILMNYLGRQNDKLRENRELSKIT